MAERITGIGPLRWELHRQRLNHEWGILQEGGEVATELVGRKLSSPTPLEETLVDLYLEYRPDFLQLAHCLHEESLAYIEHPLGRDGAIGMVKAYVNRRAEDIEDGVREAVLTSTEQHMRCSERDEESLLAEAVTSPDPDRSFEKVDAQAMNGLAHFTAEKGDVNAPPGYEVTKVNLHNESYLRMLKFLERRFKE